MEYYGDSIAVSNTYITYIRPIFCLRPVFHQGGLLSNSEREECSDRTEGDSLPSTSMRSAFKGGDDGGQERRGEIAQDSTETRDSSTGGVSRLLRGRRSFGKGRRSNAGNNNGIGMIIGGFGFTGGNLRMSKSGSFAAGGDGLDGADDSLSIASGSGRGGGSGGGGTTRSRGFRDVEGEAEAVAGKLSTVIRKKDAVEMLKILRVVQVMVEVASTTTNFRFLGWASLLQACDL